VAELRPRSSPSSPSSAGSQRSREGTRWRSAADRSRSRGLTTRGRCLLAGGVAAAVCAVVLDERDLLRVGIFAATLPLIALVVGSIRRLRLSASHMVVPPRLDPGTVGRVMLSVTNNGSSRTSTLEVSEPATADLTRGVRCLVPPLKPGRQAVTNYQLTATRRGKFLLGPPRVRIGDPFGLWEEHRTLPVRSEVLVVPSVVRLAGMPVSTGSRSAAADRAAAGTIGGDPDVGIRQYRSGDDIRTIHWRASARHDELMVRLEEPVSHGGATVMLDHRVTAHRGEGAASSLETAVTLAASISLHLLEADHQIRVTTHTGAVLASGRDITDDVLAALAVIEPDPVTTMAHTAVAGSGLIVAILADIEPPAARILAAARRRGTNGVAMVLDTADWGSPAPSGRTPGGGVGIGILQAAGWRVVPVRSTEPLALAWNRACSGSPAYQRVGDRQVPMPAAR